MSQKKKLVVRVARIADVKAIRKLVSSVYQELEPYTPAQLRGQINNYPEGVLVAEYEGEVVGYCASIRLPPERVLQPHTWQEITGDGYGSTHDPDGDYLYGYEVCVDPKYRGLRIGQRLYRERRDLCTSLGLEGIVFGGRLPGLKRRLKQAGSADAYVDKVKRKEWRDPVLSFQLGQGFELLGVLKGYLPSDRDSLGYASHLIWRNPNYRERLPGEGHAHLHMPDTVRVATVQYLQRRIKSFDDFRDVVTYFVGEIATNRCDFILFPELFTVQLLSISNKPMEPAEALVTLTQYDDEFRNLMADLAIKFNINIIAGSHPSRNERGQVINTSYIFLRDGSVHLQPKIHPTPAERHWWNIHGGSELHAIDTDCGPIGVLICYDSEFPELARHLTNQGVNIIFVPFSTEDRQGYLRVRYCAQARAIENQCYVVTAGNVGNLPRVHNMDIHYAQSGIFTPCDYPFPPDGIAADTTPNVEMVAIADLRLDVLKEARNSGTVLNLLDRRHDLYRVHWHGKSRRSQAPEAEPGVGPDPTCE